MDWWMYLMIVLIVISAVFTTLGVIGLHRFPDVFTRLHAATKATTFGSIFLAAAVILFGIVEYTKASSVNQPAYITLVSHTVLALIFILITNPTGAHAIARAARRAGIVPEQAVIDEWEEEVKE
jgi:multicomponent Na+:H+ antiporter subunit G